jgi:HSP20 family protein
MKNSNSGVRHLPIQEWANDIEQVFDRFLGKPLASMATANGDSFVPSLDIAETDTEYTVHVDLPGVKSEDVKLEIHEDRLAISGKRQSETKTDGKNFHRIERRTGEFYRTVVLPNTVDQDRVEADFKDGVLNVRLPKSLKTQPKKIEIRTGSDS